MRALALIALLLTGCSRHHQVPAKTIAPKGADTVGLVSAPAKVEFTVVPTFHAYGNESSYYVKSCCPVGYQIYAGDRKLASESKLSHRGAVAQINWLATLHCERFQ